MPTSACKQLANKRRRLKRYVARLERALDQIANVLEDCEAMHGPLGGRHNADLDDDPLVQIDRILVRTWGSTHKPSPSPPPICPTCGDEGCMQ